ncbi:MAG: hypothetical protein ACYC7E_11860 [Armatimonadota bacterium]
MGLYVHNIGNLPVDDSRKYFLYVLDYGWQEPLTDTLVANFRNMARMASETKSVVVAGIDPVHFANEVFSWHGINGEDGEKMLPALMITTLHPSYFRDHNHEGDRTAVDDALLLIPLKKVCKTNDEVVELIKMIFADIRQGKALSGFHIAKTLRKDGIRRFADAVILEPSFAGVGIDVKKVISAILGTGR